MTRDTIVDVSYWDGLGREHRVPAATLEAFRSTLDTPLDARGDARRALVVRRGGRSEVPERELELEDGARLVLDGRLPADLPLGYHTLRGEGGERRLVVSPGRCHLPESFRAWGWAVQLYAARSRGSWGMGDFADLRSLAEWSKDLGAGMLLVSPALAVAPIRGQQPSPYYPASRRFLNPIYLRVEEVPGAERAGDALAVAAAAGRALGEDSRIDRDRVWALKLGALEAIWRSGPPPSDFERWRETHGEPLETFTLWCALAEEHGGDWRSWPHELRRPDGAGAAAAREGRADRLRFHAWLQWLCTRQLEASAGSTMIVQDLPIGFDRGGADAWAWQDLLALDVSIGAPPDEFNTRGQDWGLPPFVPRRLAEAGYEPFIQSLRAGLMTGGGLRIDHVMGLFRQFWIPGGAAPDEGAYVRYPSSELLDILALESHRAGAVVVGEDLGTVEPAVREELARRRILSYRLLWFEPDAPSTWPELSMASVTTHDLATVTGLWSGADFEEQERLGMAPDAASVERIRQGVAERTGLDEAAGPEEVVVEVHRLLAEAPSRIVCASLDDVALAPSRPNIPGADGGRANWSLALPRPIEELVDDPLARELAEVFNAAVAGRPPEKAGVDGGT